MKILLKVVAFAIFVASIAFLSGCGSASAKDIDLGQALDITMDTMERFDQGIHGQEDLNADETFIQFAEQLAFDYNLAQPALHHTRIGVNPQQDASLLAYEEKNDNNVMDEGEEPLFLIEIDGQNSRIIATSRSGAVSDHGFSGTGLLAGFLIGSLLSRQSAAGVNTRNLANKQTVTAQQAARARAGSGSHAKGK